MFKYSGNNYIAAPKDPEDMDVSLELVAEEDAVVQREVLNIVPKSKRDTLNDTFEIVLANDTAQNGK